MEISEKDFIEKGRDLIRSYDSEIVDFRRVFENLLEGFPLSIENLKYFSEKKKNSLFRESNERERDT